MALFGLSPLILSFLASTWFMVPQRGLDVANYTASLAVLTAVIHVIGAFNLRVEPATHQREATHPSGADVSMEDTSDFETSPLLPKKSYLGSYDSFWDVLREPHFWILACVSLLVLGSVSQLFRQLLLLLLRTN